MIGLGGIVFIVKTPLRLAYHPGARMHSQTLVGRRLAFSDTSPNSFQLFPQYFSLLLVRSPFRSAKADHFSSSYTSCDCFARRHPWRQPLRGSFRNITFINSLVTFPLKREVNSLFPLKERL